MNTVDQAIDLMELLAAPSISAALRRRHLPGKDAPHEDRSDVTGLTATGFVDLTPEYR